MYYDQLHILVCYYVLECSNFPHYIPECHTICMLSINRLIGARYPPLDVIDQYIHFSLSGIGRPTRCDHGQGNRRIKGWLQAAGRDR